MKNKRALNEHTRIQRQLHPSYVYVVLDNKTRRETGYETLDEAEKAVTRLSIETNTAYRFTIHHKEGEF